MAEKEEEAHYDRVKQFVLEWDIDSYNVVDFMRLSLEHQDDIMARLAEEHAEDSAEQINNTFQRAVADLLQGVGDGGSAAVSDPIQRFAEKWELNRNAIQRLHMLPQNLLDEVIDTFSPPAHTRDRSSTLVAFVRKLIRMREDTLPAADEHMDIEDEVERFVLKWKLSEKAVSFLRELPQDQLDRTIQTFAPPKKAGNMTSRLVSFVKRFIRPKVVEESGADPVEVFERKWGLSPAAIAKLRALPEDVANETMQQFAPPPGTRDISHKLINFISGKISRGDRREAERSVNDVQPEDEWADPVEKFIRKFNLAREAQERLTGLAPAQLDETLEKFSPPPNTKNMTSAFLYFVDRFIDSKHEDSTWKSEASEGSRGQQKSDRVKKAAGSRHYPCKFFALGLCKRGDECAYLHTRDEASVGKESPWLNDFLAKWNLGDAARRHLCALEPELQEKVIDTFNPPGKAQNNYQPKLIHWIKVVKAKQMKGTSDGDNTSVAEFGEDERDLMDASSPVEAFAQRFNLTDESMAQFHALPMELQDEVMATFAPRDGSRDANPLFVSFLERYATIMYNSPGPTSASDFEAHPIDEFAQLWSLSEEAVHRLTELPEDMQIRVMAEFNPSKNCRDPNTKFMAYMKSVGKKAEAPPPRPSSSAPEAPASTVDEFADKWALNDAAYGMLLGLPADLQDHAVASFNPGPNTRDTSSKFMAYVKRNVLKNSGQQHQQQGADPIDEFAERWLLNENAVNTLCTLSPEHQAEAMERFDPPPDTHDTSTKFVAFCRTLGRAKPSVGPSSKKRPAPNPSVVDVDDFAHRWGLSSDAMQFLIELPGELQREAMDNFNPGPKTRDINGKFLSYGKALIGERPTRKRARHE